MVPILDLINHRRGRYSNVNSTSVHGQDDIHVFASQNILGGEQLHFSYSECIDCEGLSLTYVAQHMVTHFGFVEQFPRRWRFDTSPEATIFDLDELSVIKSNQLSKTATGEEVGGDDTLTTLNPHQMQQMQVSWLSPKPDLKTINFMRAHLKRVQNLHEEVFEQTRQFHSKHERDLTIEFYGALKMALQHAIWAAMDTFRQSQITWLQSKGGYLNDKIEIKDIESTTINDDDTSASVSGLFATKDILEGEKLIVIPRKCLLVSDDGMCGTTQKLMREFSLGSDSEFAPYVQHVFQQKRGILPSAWSSAAKDLLHKM